MDPIRALLDGHLSQWHGLPPDAGAAALEVEDRGGGLLIARGDATGPEGALLTTADDGHVVLVELPDPRIPLAAVDALGEPELEEPTPWSRVGSQRAWPSRGLAVHAHFDGVVRVVGFAPMTVDAFRAAPFATKGAPPQRRRL